MTQAILFDADGVLVDAGEMHYQAFNQALAVHGWCITRVEHRTIYDNLPTRGKLERLTETKGLPRELHQTILVAKERFIRKTITDYLKPDPTKIELLRELREQGYAIAACSNMLQGALTLMMDQVRLLSHLDVVIGNDLQRPAKPAPNVYLAAAALTGHDIQDCAIVVDRAVSREAAERARPGDIVEVAGPSEVTLALAPRLFGVELAA